MLTTLKIEGMSCQGCVRNVTQILQSQAGVTKAEVSLEKAQAQVEHSAEADPQTLCAVVNDAGFDASVQ